MGDATVDFRLGDALQRGAEELSIGGRAERDSLRAGDLARLLFGIIEPGNRMPRYERIWLGVTGREPGGYTGVLTNAPAFITMIRQGDAIRFRPERVISTQGDWPLPGEEDPPQPLSHEQDQRPCSVSREDPDTDQDSGWRAGER